MNTTIRSVRRMLEAALLTAAVGLSFPAAAADRQEFNIPAGDLAPALRALAKQAGLEVIFLPDDLKGIKTQGVKGKLSPREAVAKMIDGTQLKITTDPAGAILVAPTQSRAGDLSQVANLRLAESGNPPAVSAPAESSAENADPAGTGQIVVTGSHIRGVGAPAGSAVVVIDREMIERSGYTTTADVVRMLPQNFQGSFDEMSRFANLSTTDNANNSTGASGANLRGLGADATLTLLNGRRLSASGAWSSAGDLSLIPLSAVERVEVLLDGASAIYGSDAVGGVVNIILKKTYTGAQTLVENSQAARGSYGVLRLVQTLSRGWGGGGALLSYEYRDQDALYQRERNFVAAPSQTSVFVPPSRVNSVMARIHQQVTPRVQLSLETLVGKRRQDAAPIIDGVTLGFESEQVSGTAAADITIGDSWNSTVSATLSDAENTMGNEVLSVNVGSYILTDNRAWDVIARFSGPLVTLPGGEMRLAFGAEHHWTGLGMQTVTTVGAPPPGGKYDRDSDGVYAELSVPLVGEGNAFGAVRSLMLSLAGRYEEYSDFGTSDTYKLGLSWTLAPGLVLRGTYGTSFRAPGLIQLYGDNTSSIQRQADPLSSTGTSVVFTKTGANRDLVAEEAVSNTFGIDYSFERVPGLRVSATYFATDYTDRIELPRPTLAQPVLFAAFLLRDPTPAQIAEAYAQFPVASNSGGFTPADIRVIRDSRLSNTASAYIRGVDLSVDHRFSTGAGAFTLNASASRFLDYRLQLIAGGPSSDRIDTALYPTSWKMRGSLGWDREGWAASAAVNYINRHLDRSTVTPSAVEGFTTVDLRLAYYFQRGFARDLQISLAARNVFDRDPPVMRNLSVGYDPANTNPLGRVLSLNLRKDW